MENIENKQKKTVWQKVKGFVVPAAIVAGSVTVGILYGSNKFGVKTKVDGAGKWVKNSCSNGWKRLTTRKSTTECAGDQCVGAETSPNYQYSNNNQPRQQKWNNNNGGGNKFNKQA